MVGKKHSYSEWSLAVRSFSGSWLYARMYACARIRMCTHVSATRKGTKEVLLAKSGRKRRRNRAASHVADRHSQPSLFHARDVSPALETCRSFIFRLHARLSGNDTVLHVVTACPRWLLVVSVFQKTSNIDIHRFSIFLLYIHAIYFLYTLFIPSPSLVEASPIHIFLSPTLGDPFSLVTHPPRAAERKHRRGESVEESRQREKEDQCEHVR